MKIIALSVVLMTFLTGCGVDWFPSDSTTSSTPVSITTSTLADAPTGFAYSQKLTASGGTGTYTWSVVSVVTLPDGLNLNLDSGLITGTPTVLTNAAPISPLVYKITVKVSDSATPQMTATRDLTIFTPTTGRMYDTTGKVYAETLTSTVNATTVALKLIVSNQDVGTRKIQVVVVNYDNNGNVIVNSDVNMNPVTLNTLSSDPAVTGTFTSTGPTDNNWRIKTVTIIP